MDERFTILSRFLSDFYPRACHICGSTASDATICANCYPLLPLATTGCTVCAAPLAKAGVCGRCQKDKPVLDELRVLFEFRPPIDQFIHKMKYRDRLFFSVLFGEIMAKTARREDWGIPQCLIPIPLHRRRLRKRGYNQSLLLAREISRRLGISLDAGNSRRLSFVRSQTGSSSLQRQRNVQNAFEHRLNLQGQHIAIVDDVITTGATLNAFARVLRQQGAGLVSAWVIARTTLTP